MTSSAKRTRPLARFISLHPAIQHQDITKRETTIGRQATCDIVVESRYIAVSNMHCRCIITADLAMVEDISTNGCWLNMKPMRKGETRPLAHGDELTINKLDDAITFVFEDKRTENPGVMLVEMHESGVLNEYQFGKTLGQGSFGMVVQAIHKPTNECRAVKLVNKAGALSNGIKSDSIYCEFEVLNQLSHPNIVTLHESFDTPSTIVVALEYATGGDLDTYLHQKREHAWHLRRTAKRQRVGALAQAGGGAGAGAGKKRVPITIMPESDAKALFFQIISALSYLHEKSCVHRDLKPQNCLLFARREEPLPLIKITDFGFAKILGDSYVALQTVCGTPTYVAPEIFLHHQTTTSTGALEKPRGYGPRVDLWSAGVMLYEFLCGINPFRDVSTEQYLAHITSQGHLRQCLFFPKGVSLQAADLVFRLLAHENNRLTAVQALAHEWFSGAPRAASEAPVLVSRQETIVTKGKRRSR